MIFNVVLNAKHCFLIINITKNAFKLLSVLTLCLLPLSLAAGDPDPDKTPSCAPHKPVAATARKVVRPNAGPWDKPNFVWGLSPPLPTTQRASLLRVTCTGQKLFQFKLGEETFQLNLANPNWDDVPDEMKNAERISYKESRRPVTLWQIDQTFFSHFPQCKSVDISCFRVPPQVVLDPLKVICLRNDCTKNTTEAILRSLPLFQNLRALDLNFGISARGEVGDFTPLTSLTKLQALRITMPHKFWSADHCAHLKQTIQNTHLREISLATVKSWRGQKPARVQCAQRPSLPSCVYYGF